MGGPAALHHCQLPLVLLVEVEDVELWVPVVELVQELEQVWVIWLLSECLWLGQGWEPSGLGSELQVPVHGHTK